MDSTDESILKTMGFISNPAIFLTAAALNKNTFLLGKSRMLISGATNIWFTSQLRIQCQTLSTSMTHTFDNSLFILGYYFLN